MDPQTWIQIEQTYAADLDGARRRLGRLMPADTPWPVDKVVPFLADLLLVGAAADALPGLVAQEAPPSVVDDMELLRTQILAAITALVGDDDDGIPPAFRDAFRDE